MPVRSAELAHGQLAAGESRTVYSVAGGSTVILKEIRLFNGAPTDGLAYIQLGTPAAPTMVDAAVIPPYQGRVISSWTVLEPGHVIHLWNGRDTAFNYWASGAILPGVA